MLNWPVCRPSPACTRPLSASLLTPLLVPLAGMLALLVGLVCVSAGVARLGFVADLLSAPVRLGYLAGLAVTIFVGQLPKLFGFSTDADSFVGEIIAFIQNLDQTNIYALAVGLLCLAIIMASIMALPIPAAMFGWKITSITLSIPGTSSVKPGSSTLSVIPSSAAHLGTRPDHRPTSSSRACG